MTRPKIAVYARRPKSDCTRPCPQRRLRPLIAIVPALLVAALSVSCSRGRPEITENELRDHLAVLGSSDLDGRLPGTAGYDSAAAYAARILAAAGVEPGEPVKVGERAFLQLVPLVRNRVGKGTFLELRTRNGIKRVPPDRRSFLLLAAGTRGGAELRPPVYVGNGLYAPEYGVDDFAGLDLTGRTVLMSASLPDEAELARLPAEVRKLYADHRSGQLRRLGDVVQRGAAALLLLPDRWLVDEWDAISAVHNRLDYGPAEDYPGEVEPPIPAAVLHADLVDWMFLGRPYHPISHVGRYQTFELSDIALRLVIDVKQERVNSANVVGVVTGRDRNLRGEYVVVGAQLDGPGVGDERVYGRCDVTAPAALLEAAASLAADPPRRSVVFAFFTAETGGGWGATHFLAHLPVNRSGITAALQVGPLCGTARGVSGTTAFAPPALLGTAREAARGLGDGLLRVKPASAAPAHLQGAASAAFEGAGIPTVLLSDDGAPEPAVVLPPRKGIDLDCLASATRALRQLIIDAADQPAPTEVRRRTE